MPQAQETVLITPAPNGPLLVKGEPELRTESGAIETKPTMALCRCGASANKPFCDGTHGKIGFSSENAADPARDTLDDYVGREVTVHDNRHACAHAGFCTDRLPSVFRMKQEPWIDPDGARPEEVIAVVRACPSGALRSSQAGDAHPEPSGKASIFIAKNGPYVVTGEAEIEGVARATGASETRTTLCRCGASKNKPFCDGTHWNEKFDPAE